MINTSACLVRAARQHGAEQATRDPIGLPSRMISRDPWITVEQDPGRGDSKLERGLPIAKNLRELGARLGLGAIAAIGSAVGAPAGGV